MITKCLPSVSVDGFGADLPGQWDKRKSSLILSISTYGIVARGKFSMFIPYDLKLPNLVP